MMERPTKPVIWTDKEANERLKLWLKESGYHFFPMTTNGSYFNPTPDNDHDYVKVPHNKFTDIEFEVALKRINKSRSITPDSLLHDLNIIKPIGHLQYTSDWIDKILSGQKTMDILPVQHACGYYELWDTDRQEVRGIVEVDAVHKLIMVDGELHMYYIDHGSFPIYIFWRDACGFDSDDEFADYHRNSSQSVKYAITYHVVDMKGDGE